MIIAALFIKILIDNLYEVFPSHIVDGVENERVLYHSFNKYIIEQYPMILDRNISKASASDYKNFFNEVIIFDSINTTELINNLNPDIIVKGGEWTAEEVREREGLYGYIPSIGPLNKENRIDMYTVFRKIL